MNKIIFLFIVGFLPQSMASHLYYIDTKATFARYEKISSVIMGTDRTVSIHSKTMSCVVKTKSANEAFKVRQALIKESKTWIQCHGNHTKPKGRSVYLKTSDYSLVKKI